MSKKTCAFCGKEFEGESNCCKECNEHAEKRYSTVFCDGDNTSSSSKYKVSPVEGETESAYREEQQYKKNKRNSKAIKKIFTAFVVVFTLMIVSGGLLYLSERKKEDAKIIEANTWYASIEENTPLAYSKYLLAYPQGEYSKEALARIKELRDTEEKAWQELRKSQDLNDYYTFLTIYPETPFKSKIKWVMDSLTWDITLKENSPEAYLAYIENSELGNIEGHYKKMANERYEYLSSIKEIEGEELEVVQLRLKNLFESLSDKNYPNLEEYLSPQVSNLFGMRSFPAVAGTDSLKKRIETEKIDAVTYTVILDSVPVKKDNKGVYFSRFPVIQDIKYKGKQKAEQIQDTVYLELDAQRKVKNLFVIDRPNEV